MNIEAIVHKAAVEIDRTKKGDVDRIEVIVLQAVRDGAKAILRTNLGKVWPEPTKKNPNRGYVSE